MEYGLYTNFPSYKVQKDIDYVHLWCQYNKLTVNYDKAKLVLHTRSKDNAHPTVTLNGICIKYQHQYNYLGVIVDKHLTFKQQIQKTNNSA